MSATSDLQTASIAIIPARNEEKAVGQVVASAIDHVSCVVVIDDSSSDNTAAVAKLNGAIVLKMPTNVGYSKSLLAGCSFALENEFNSIVMLDADGAHDPDDIPILIDAHMRHAADFTLGNRFHSHPKFNIPSSKESANAFAAVMVNRILGTNIRDAACGFRVLSRNFAESLIRLGSMNGFSLAYRCLALFSQNGYRIATAPVSVRYDASDLLCTTQSELLDLLAVCSSWCDPGSRNETLIRSLIEAASNMAAFTLSIPDRILCVHPIRDSAYIFQPQIECFSANQAGQHFDLRN